MFRFMQSGKVDQVFRVFFASTFAGDEDLEEFYKAVKLHCAIHHVEAATAVVVPVLACDANPLTRGMFIDPEARRAVDLELMRSCVSFVRLPGPYAQAQAELDAFHTLEGKRQLLDWESNPNKPYGETLEDAITTMADIYKTYLFGTTDPSIDLDGDSK